MRRAVELADWRGSATLIARSDALFITLFSYLSTAALLLYTSR